jgi:hypothetical protein
MRGTPPVGRRVLAGAVHAALLLGRRALAAGIRGALAMWRQALAAAASETGRRLGRAAALTLALAVVVVTLYERGEVPTAAAQPAVAGAGAATGAPAGRARARARRLEEHGGLRGRPRPARVGERARPAEVAAAWYAARNGLPAARVKALQQDRLSARVVRVLVLADPGGGRLRTALVRVQLGPTGWSVR